jgi:acyl-CoA synthetase (AMP-forming)/AMP-acid ligase II
LAWTFGDRARSYGQLGERVAALAGGLTRSGLTPGDRVVLVLPNSPALVEVLLASMWAGLVAVPLNWHLHPQEVSYVIEHCGASAVLVAEPTRAVLEVVPAGVLVIRADDRGEVDLPLDGVGLPIAHRAPEDPAWLFYTSGTTGRPKGATLSHRNLMAMTLNYYSDIDPVAPASVFAHAAPLTRGSGLYLLPAIGRGAHNVISAAPSFDADGFLALLAEYGATHATFLAPTMLKRLLTDADPRSHDLSRLRSIVVGGAPLYREDLRAAIAAFGPIITQIYGQGESPMTITVAAPMSRAEVEAARGSMISCGRAFTGVEVQVVDADNNPLPAGVDGEVCVRGDVVMQGYWNDPVATAAAIRGGWLCTGDIGHLDAGEQLFLTDRAKDVIITGGSNVYPREVEEVLLAHPDVREVAVIGLPDEQWGESICACVVPVAADRWDPDGLLSHCRANLASFKKPRHLVPLDELPKSAAGKILKRVLREQLRSSAQPGRPSATASS